MTRSGPIPGASTRRKGYESVNNDVSDEESLLVSDDSFEEVRHGKVAARADLTTSESDAEDEDVVKLLSAGAKQTEPHESAASRASLPTSDVPSDEQDVGLRIEQVLERERNNMLSESFDTDLEDGNSNLVLSDDDDDYGIPLVKASRGKPRREDQGWKSGLRTVFPLKAWWHAIPLGVVAVGVIWLAMQGLYWLRSERPGAEYVSFLFVLTGCCCVRLVGTLLLGRLSADGCRNLYLGTLLRWEGRVLHGRRVIPRRMIWWSG